MPAIPAKSTPVDTTGTWDAGLNVGRLPNDSGEAKFRQMYAWVDPNKDPNTKAAYSLPHHNVSPAGVVGAANMAGVRNALSRLPQSNIPTGDQAAVRAHLQRHMDDAAAAKSASAELPQDQLVRATFGSGILLREADGTDAADGGGGPSVMTGHFAVFDTWTEINSLFEGNFLERIAPGAFKKTMREQKDTIKVLFQHGQEYTQGDKPLGTIKTLREDDVGALYDVELLDVPYVNELVPGLRAGLYGASFRFKVTKDNLVSEPEKSDYNPDGLPERTIKEVKLYEFGPVTFPAYSEATAGVRSITDDFITLGMIRENPERFGATLERAGMLAAVCACNTNRADTLPDVPAANGTGASASRERITQAEPSPEDTPRRDNYLTTRKEEPWRL